MLNHDQQLRFVKARRGAIARDFARLNPEQQKAALATEGPLLLLAGAGSGKTTVLIHRIANLMRYGRGSDSVEVPDWAGEDDLTFLEHCARGGRSPRRRSSGGRSCAAWTPPPPGPFWLSPLPIRRPGS